MLSKYMVLKSSGGELHGEAQGLAWSTNPGPFRSRLSSHSRSQIQHRLSQLLLFFPDCPAQLPRPDLTSYPEGKEIFGEPRDI